jgi:hypothetical protein
MYCVNVVSNFVKKRFRQSTGSKEPNSPPPPWPLFLDVINKKDDSRGLSFPYWSVVSESFPKRNSFIPPARLLISFLRRKRIYIGKNYGMQTSQEFGWNISEHLPDQFRDIQGWHTAGECFYDMYPRRWVISHGHELYDSAVVL